MFRYQRIRDLSGQFWGARECQPGADRGCDSATAPDWSAVPHACHHAGGRHGRRHGGHPGGGPGGFGFPPFGFGGRGPGGLGFHSGRKLSSVELQLLLLALLEERPRHGYDLIKALEERSNGFYVPSPGVIYPALTYLEEAGEAQSEAQGSRKLFQLSEAGRLRLEEHRGEVDTLLSQLSELGKRMDRLRDAFSRDPDAEEFQSPREFWSQAPELFEAMRQLRSLFVKRHGISRDQWLRVAQVLHRSVDDIRAILNADDDEKS